MTEYYFDTTHARILRNLGAEDSIQSPDFIPLAQLLMSDEFPFEPDDFPRISYREWDREQGIAFGKVIANVLDLDAEKAPMQKEHIRRLNILGLMPDYNYLREQFGSLASFAHAVGSNSAQRSDRFSQMSNDELLVLIRKTLGSTVDEPKRLTLQDIEQGYTMGKLPGRKYLYSRLGHISRINFLLGLVDDEEWEPEDFLQYGVDFVKINGPEMLVRSVFETLSKKRQSPSAKHVSRTFGSWGEYKEAVIEKVNAMAREEAERKQRVQQFITEVHGKEYDANDIAQERLWALHVLEVELIGEKCAYPSVDTSKQAIRNSIERIQRMRPSLMLADIQETAYQLGILESIWPVEPNPLHVPALH